MNLTEEEMSAAIDEPARLTAELHRLLKEKKLHLITEDHYKAYRAISDRLNDMPIDWEEFDKSQYLLGGY